MPSRRQHDNSRPDRSPAMDSADVANGEGGDPDEHPTGERQARENAANEPPA